MFSPIWQGYTVRKVLTGSLFFLAAIHVVNAQTPQSFVFVAEPKSHTIDAFAITPVSGALTLVPGSPFAAPNESICTAAPGCSTTPPSIATNSDATFLFTANYTSSSISVFSIATNGALAEIAGSPFPIPDALNPNMVTVSPNGQLLYVGSSFASSGPNGMLDEFAIAGSGSLSFLTSASAPIVPVGIYIHPSGQFVYVYGGAGVNGATLQGFSTQNATLTPLTPLQENETPNALIGDVAGEFLYTAWSESDSFGHIDSIAIGSDGNLSLSSTFSDHVDLLSITNLASGGTFLFTNENTYSISGGVLTPINPAPGNSVPTPLAATASFLFEGDQALGQGNGPLIFPFVVANNGQASNADPPLNLSGIPSQIIVATGTTSATSAPAVVFEPASFNFSPVTGGQTSLAQLTIYSTGSVPLTISDVSVTGSAFTEQSSTCPSSLSPSESCFVYITFEPSAAGTFTGSFNLTGNVSGTVPLSGTGTPPTQFTLQTSAVGPGTIQQAPSGTSFAAGASIMLTAVSNSNALFTGWSGACAGSTNAVCTFSITANTTVTATFIPNPTVTASQPSQSGAPGSTFTFQINEAGFTTKPTLTATCSIPKGGCSITGTTLTITTTGSNSGFVTTYFPQAPLAPSLTLALILSGVLSITLLFSNPRARRILGAAAVVGSFVILAACGSSSGGANPNTGTPAGNYIVSIQAVAGTFTAGTTVSITVQ
jgi:uncharacterized repeat protein (TIGR02543 family)